MIMRNVVVTNKKHSTYWIEQNAADVFFFLYNIFCPIQNKCKISLGIPKKMVFTFLPNFTLSRDCLDLD